jgi:hypothetical protein
MVTLLEPGFYGLPPNPDEIAPALLQDKPQEVPCAQATLTILRRADYARICDGLGIDDE